MDPHALSGDRQTERYIHVKVEKNTKGYNVTSSFSIRTTDERIHMGDALKELDMAARQAEIDALSVREESDGS